MCVLCTTATNKVYVSGENRFISDSYQDTNGPNCGCVVSQHMDSTYCSGLPTSDLIKHG